MKTFITVSDRLGFVGAFSDLSAANVALREYMGFPFVYTEWADDAGSPPEGQAAERKVDLTTEEQPSDQTEEQSAGLGRPTEGMPTEGSLGHPEEGRPSDLAVPQSDDPGRPAKMQPAEGQPEEGRPAEGQPEERRPEEGRPEEGRPGEGRPAEGRPAEGQPEEGQPEEGRPGDLAEGSPGQPGEGQPAEGRPDEGQPAEGRPAEGRPDEGQPEEGRPSEGRPSGLAGDSVCGHPKKRGSGRQRTNSGGVPVWILPYAANGVLACASTSKSYVKKVQFELLRLDLVFPDDLKYLKTKMDTITAPAKRRLDEAISVRAAINGEVAEQSDAETVNSFLEFAARCATIPCGSSDVNLLLKGVVPHQLYE